MGVKATEIVGNEAPARLGSLKRGMCFEVPGCHAAGAYIVFGRNADGTSVKAVNINCGTEWIWDQNMPVITLKITKPMQLVRSLTP